MARRIEMSRFPRQYAESTLNRMYKKLKLSEGDIKLLEDYFDAFSNLYNILPLRDAYKIIDSQNKGMLTEEQFAAFSEIMRHDKPVGRFYYVLGNDELYLGAPKSESMDRMIVNESLVDIDYEHFYKLDDAQHGKPLCILSKEETLKYSDQFYIPQTPQLKALKKFLREKLKIGEKQANGFVTDCHMIITCAEPTDMLNDIFKMAERINVPMTEKQAEEFVGLVYDINNNTRLPSNRGYTPNELAKQCKRSAVPEVLLGPNITAALQNGEIDAEDMAKQIAKANVPDEMKVQMIGELMMSSRPTAHVKVGRNDLCPCGSGKKYKKCCGR